MLDQFWELYAKHKELVVAITSAVVTCLLMKLGPFALGLCQRATWRIFRAWGGRFAARAGRQAYLNWVVHQNQDLNLTGIVGRGSKPKLEQVFISLRFAGGPAEESQ